MLIEKFFISQNSYIALKLQEAKEGKEDSGSLCTISWVMYIRNIY